MVSTGAYLPEELRLKSHITQRYGKGFIPEGMTIQDFGVSYEELEPYFDQFERVCGTSGKAGNLNGTIVDGGNPFEGKRSQEFPLAPAGRMSTAPLCLPSGQGPRLPSLFRTCLECFAAVTQTPMALSSVRATSAAIANALAVICMPRPRRKQPFCRCC